MCKPHKLLKTYKGRLPSLRTVGSNKRKYIAIYANKSKYNLAEGTCSLQEHQDLERRRQTNRNQLRGLAPKIVSNKVWRSSVFQTDMRPQRVAVGKRALVAGTNDCPRFSQTHHSSDIHAYSPLLTAKRLQSMKLCCLRHS